jgi:group I intron endonuclease
MNTRDSIRIINNFINNNASKYVKKAWLYIYDIIKNNKNIGCVYCLYFENNPIKKYYGSSLNFVHRMDLHLNALKNQKHHNIFLQQDCNKYGLKNLTFDILYQHFDKINLFKKEQEYIKNDNQCYNLTIYNYKRQNKKQYKILLTKKGKIKNNLNRYKL